MGSWQRKINEFAGKALDKLGSGNIRAMRAPALSYPLSGKFDDIEDTGGYRTNFVASIYSNKQVVRVLSPSAGPTFADITLPLPQQIKTDNEIAYSQGQSEVKGGITDPTVGGAIEWALEKTKITGVMDKFGISQALGHRPMDETENVFGGANFRTHSYSWQLIPKVEGAGTRITDIVKKFQTLAYPSRSIGQSYSRVIHPPVWFISVLNLNKGDKGGQFMWDMGPLPSVLSRVGITTQGSAAVSYTHLTLPTNREV
mgnify:FL=1